MNFRKYTFVISTCLLFFSCSNDPEINNTPQEPSIKEGFLGQLSFIKTLGGSKNDLVSSIIKTTDGGYAMTGYTASSDGDFNTKTSDDSDFILLKYNANDVLEWFKTYGGSKDDRGTKIINTIDNGFAILGFSKSNDGDSSNNAGNSDLWLTKLDSNGTLTWEKSFGYSGVDFGTALIQTKDSGYLIVGELDVTSSGGLGNSKASKSLHAGGDFWAIKLNNKGEKEWSKYFGGNFTDTPQSVIETINGDFIIGGTSDSSDVDIKNNQGTYDFWVVKIDKTGKLLWEKSFGGSQIDESFGMVETNDNDFVLVGNTRSTDKNVSQNNGAADLWLVKINTQGNLLWEKTFGGTSFDVGNSIKTMKDGHFLISGSSRSSDNQITNKGQNDAWILKVSNQGNLLWQKTFGGSDIDLCHDAIELNDGTIIAVGESTSKTDDIKENKGFSDILIIKLK
ncbi:conserved protein of unknown function [Tenacibaculum sp. 190524A02b]|uniref:hypothetical protein n=1 Tax=Tenacibaculum vairaonense TaxID=3137860 RepID=UPI0032B116D1